MSTHRNCRGSTRRQFLQGTALASIAFAAPQIVPASVLGANAPSNRIGVGIIGAGNQCTVDLPCFLGNESAQVLAICDVNTGSHGYKTPEQFLGRKPMQERVNKFYAEKTGAGQYRGCGEYVDFREVLASKDIDAVVIIVPDQWHALMTIAACKAGKDIYCEKPLSLTIHDGQQMVKAIRQYKRMLQVGSPWRSSPAVRHMCELVRNGRIGKLQKIVSSLPPNNAVSPGVGWKPMPVPEGFDYEMWLGPAPSVPYHIDRCLYRFRFIKEYSGGQVTNFGAHSNDIAQWAHASDDTGPVEIEDLGGEFPPQGDLFSTALKADFRARYADGVELHCATTGAFGVRFEGTEGWIEFTYKGVKSNPESLKDSQLGPNEVRLPASNPERSGKEKGSRYVTEDHVADFLRAVKTRQDPIEPVEVGHRTATVCHLGNIAMLLRRKLRWDPVKEQFIGDDEANAMLRRPYRGPWKLES